MKTYICENCGLIEEENTRIIERVETLPVKGEDVTFNSRVRVCVDCNEELSDEELDNQTLLLAYDIYRQRHGIISPNEIRALRVEYGLTQRSLSSLLGLGEISIHRYEKGSLPDEAHNQLLRFIQDPWNMKRLFDQNREKLTSSMQRKVEERLDAVINAGTTAKLDEIIAGQRQKANILTGFKSFEPDVLMEMMVYFAGRQDPVYKTKMNKLLFYADFCHFREHSVSISGTTYCHLPHGPVPDRYGFYMDRLVQESALTIKEIDCDVYVAEQLVARREPDQSVFSPDALKTLEFVSRYFSGYTSTQIKHLSHEEAAYKETGELEPIPYSFAENLHVPTTIGVG